MKLYKIALILLGIVLLTISAVKGVPPITTEFIGDTGLGIEANIFDYYKTNEGACAHIYVFNRSNGEILGNDSVSCMVELTDHNGTIIFEGAPEGHSEHFDICRPANIVTKEETYGLTIVCNSSSVGGLKTAFFEATRYGDAPRDNLNNILTITLFSILFIVIGIYIIYKGREKDNG